MGDLENRRKSLEEKFFADLDDELINEINQSQNSQKSLETLKEETGIKNVILLQKLSDSGLGSSTLASLKFIPLLHVAWCDGNLDESEKIAIVNAADELGIKPGNINYKLLKGWLAAGHRPDRWDTWVSYIGALKSNPETAGQVKDLGAEIIAFAKDVAQASGGLFGFGSVSGEEKSALKEIAAVFN